MAPASCHNNLSSPEPESFAKLSPVPEGSRLRRVWGGQAWSGPGSVIVQDENSGPNGHMQASVNMCVCVHEGTAPRLRPWGSDRPNEFVVICSREPLVFIASCWVQSLQTRASRSSLLFPRLCARFVHLQQEEGRRRSDNRHRNRCSGSRVARCGLGAVDQGVEPRHFQVEENQPRATYIGSTALHLRGVLMICQPSKIWKFLTSKFFASWTVSKLGNVQVEIFCGQGGGLTRTMSKLDSIQVENFCWRNGVDWDNLCGSMSWTWTQGQTNIRLA